MRLIVTPDCKFSSVPSDRGSVKPANAVERIALDRLCAHPHFHGRESLISIHFDDGTLTLDGCVPSYYLKQLLQEAVRDIQEVRQIDNEVRVVNPQGYSFWPNAEPNIATQAPYEGEIQ